VVVSVNVGVGTTNVAATAVGVGVVVTVIAGVGITNVAATAVAATFVSVVPASGPTRGRWCSAP